MIDFTVTRITNEFNLYCSLFFFIIIGLYWRRATIRRPYGQSHGTGWFYLLVAVFAVTSFFNGDFFGYQALVSSYYHGIEGFHLEKIYEYIIELTGQNYLLFRVVVWGGATILFYYITKIYKVNALQALFVMFLLYTIQYTYARATLAMAVYFLGFSIFSKYQAKHNAIGIILGIIIIVASLLFHNSMAVMIILTIFYFIPINKRTLYPIIIVLAFFSIFMDQFISTFIDNLLGLGSSSLDARLEEILEGGMGERDRGYRTIFGGILLIWQYVPFYLPFLIISKIMIDKESIIKSQLMTSLFRITFSVVLLSTGLLLFSSGSLTFFYRYLYMSFIPLSILTVFLFGEGFMSKKIFNTILWVCGGYNMFIFLGYILRVL